MNSSTVGARPLSQIHNNCCFRTSYKLCTLQVGEYRSNIGSQELVLLAMFCFSELGLEELHVSSVNFAYGFGIEVGRVLGITCDRIMVGDPLEDDA